MSEDIKRMDIKEFRENGYLQEANRLFFHPLGLALEVIIDDETGEECIGGVWDFRDDPEGILYGESTLNTEQHLEKARRIVDERSEKAKTRMRKYGFVEQPITIKR